MLDQHERGGGVAGERGGGGGGAGEGGGGGAGESAISRAEMAISPLDGAVSLEMVEGDAMYVPPLHYRYITVTLLLHHRCITVTLVLHYRYRYVPPFWTHAVLTTGGEGGDGEAGGAGPSPLLPLSLSLSLIAPSWLETRWGVPAWLPSAATAQLLHRHSAAAATLPSRVAAQERARACASPSVVIYVYMYTLPRRSAQGRAPPLR